MTYKKILSSIFIFLLILTSCHEDYNNIKPENSSNLKRIQRTSLANESHLEYVLDLSGFNSISSKNGRVNGSGFELDTENILKVLQGDNVHHIYTFPIKDDFNENSFSNLVIQEVKDGGYVGYILQYEPTEKFIGLLNFTGTLRRFDLEGALLSEKEMINGQLGNSLQTNGRIKQAALCVTDILIKQECLEWGTIYKNCPGSSESMCWGCIKYGDNYTIEIVVEPCPDEETGGTSTTDTGGTYIPPSSGGTSGGGGTDTGGSGSGSTSKEPEPTPIGVILSDTEYQNIRENNFKYSLSKIEKMFLSNNPTIADKLYNYLESYLVNGDLFAEEYPQEAIGFGKWAIEYFMNHPSTTWQQFENWFVTPREGRDPLEYDSDYWENPDLSFPQQDLPTWTNFDSAYPRMNGSELVPIIGGDVEAAYKQYPSLSRGYCALKLSRGLNYAGVTIPQITTTNGNPGTVKGADGKYYFLNAKALNKWMRETFGTNPATATTPLSENHHHFTSEQGGTNGENYPTLTANLKGIYSMVSTNPAWASGHADLIEDGACVFGCHFTDTPPAPIDYIDIWVLVD